MVKSTVLLPGAGITNIVLEAGKQLVSPGKTARAFHLRDVSLFTAMALPKGVAVEMRDNCRGLIIIDHVEDTTTQMAKENAIIKAFKVAKYHRVHNILDYEYPKTSFYNHINSASWKYGEAFQGIKGCYIGDGKYDRPFFIHAGILDTVFQSWLNSIWIGGKNGGFDFTRPFIPVHFTKLEISAEIPGDVDYILRGLCLSQRYGFINLFANIFIYDKDVSKPYLMVKDFRVAELNMDDGKGQEPNYVNPADITGKICWNYALDLMEPQNIFHVICKVFEVTLNQEPVPKLIITQLPEGIFYQNQVRYVLVNPKVGLIDMEELDVKALLDTPFTGTAKIGELPQAGLVIIPNQLAIIKNYEQLIDGLLGFAEPDARIIITTVQGPPPAGFKDKGCTLEFRVDGNGPFFIYRTAAAAKPKSSAKDTPTPVRRAVFIEPLNAFEKCSAFSKSFQDILQV
ncbi:uncharacterized protein PgNI_02619 [Pyricularia grisea]|uniref:PKS/mFAS DH domain-containing protein n=1 Tax=Pyricularia grisea TaxID=148305 RepID=A0A6P8BLC4_PYRGI|nr:uncharacterized protein PgNI_02619 [Pyricularia grisea]TLD17603.1 hypothetical protein PgNI_02619 [Pyricularia grisea]